MWFLLHKTTWKRANLCQSLITLLYVFTMFHHLWISKWYIRVIMIIKTYESLFAIKCNYIVFPGCDPYCGFLYMYIKTSIQWKCFFTQGALIWFLPTMSPHMRVKITCPWRWFITLVHWYGFSPVWVIICLSRLLFIDFFFHTGCIDMGFPCIRHHIMV